MRITSAATIPMIGNLVTPLVKSAAEMASKRNYDSTVATLDANTVALEHIVQFCDENGVDRALPACLVGALQRGASASHGEKDLAAVFEIFRKKDSGGETN